MLWEFRMERWGFRGLAASRDAIEWVRACARAPCSSRWKWAENTGRLADWVGVTLGEIHSERRGLETKEVSVEGGSCQGLGRVVEQDKTEMIGRGRCGCC